MELKITLVQNYKLKIKMAQIILVNLNQKHLNCGGNSNILKAKE